MLVKIHLLRISIFLLVAAGEFDWIQANKANGLTVRKYTNIRRRGHGCPVLSLDEALSEDCEEYAQHLADTNNLTYSDPSNQNYTENLCRFEITSRRSVEQCAGKWYNGRRFDKLDSRAKEFTAMIWRSSRYMGYGDAMINAKEAMMVVRYTPPGNVPGLYTDNVPPKKNMEEEEEEKTKKKKKKKRRSCAIRHANRPSLNLFTVLIFQLLISPPIN